MTIHKSAVLSELWGAENEGIPNLFIFVVSSEFFVGLFAGWTQRVFEFWLRGN